ncbi:MAG: hypothetical protein ACTTH8_01765 [Treponema sp.]
MDRKNYLEWQEALLRLPEQIFFDLLRLYLGDIKTPFNKQRLAEQLSGFLSKPHIRHTIISSLTEQDILILTGIHFLAVPSKNALLHFFSDWLSVSPQLFNLEERLLIYQVQSGNEAEKRIYKINPLLYDVILPLLHKNLLFLPEQGSGLCKTMTASDDTLLAGLYCFFNHTTDVLRKDGSFKQKAAKLLEDIFPLFAAGSCGSAAAYIRIVCLGLQNIGLLLHHDSALVPQEDRWIEFFKLNPFDRKMYIAAGVCGKVRREILIQRANLFSYFLSSLDPAAVYTSGALSRLYYFVQQQFCRKHHLHTSFFAFDYTENKETEPVIAIAQQLRFLQPAGMQHWQINTEVFSQTVLEQNIIISPAFEVTVLPYTSFAHLFPVLSCCMPRSIQETGIFEITRTACAHCFEKNSTAQILLEALQAAILHELPQNIVVSITEWYTHYTALGLYHGFILAVSPEKRGIFTQNAALHSMIYKELADGIYLIKDMEAEDIRKIIQDAGCEVTQYTKKNLQPYTPTPFKTIEQRSMIGTDGDTALHTIRQQTAEYPYAEHQHRLEDMLEQSAFSADDKRILREKIRKKLIICEEQLSKTSLAGKIHEVSGLDFLGKIHLAERAIADHNLLEIYFDESSTPSVIGGLPIRIEKTAQDAVLFLQTQQDRIYEKIPIGRIMRMIMIKESLFF